MSPRKEQKPKKSVEEIAKQLPIQTLIGKVLYVLNDAKDKALPSQKEMALKVAELEQSLGIMPEVKDELVEASMVEAGKDKARAKIIARAKQLAPSMSDVVGRMVTLNFIDAMKSDSMEVKLIIDYDQAIEQLLHFNISRVEKSAIGGDGMGAKAPPTFVPSSGTFGGGAGGSLDDARKLLWQKYKWLTNPEDVPEGRIDPRQIDWEVDLKEFFEMVNDPQNERAIIGIDGAFQRAIVALASGRDVVLYGPPGTGKSTVMEWLAQLFGKDIQIYSVDPSWTPQKLMAGLSPTALVNPASGIEVGAFMRAIGTPKAWLGLDEMNRGDVAVYTAPIMLATSLGKVRSELLSDGYIWLPNDFRIIATANVGDEGTRRMPSAWRRRCSFVYIPFPPAEVEMKLLLEGKGTFPGLGSLMAKGRTNWNARSFVDFLVRFAWATRNNTALKAGVSTASLLKIGKEMVMSLDKGLYGKTINEDAIQMAFADAFLIEVPYQVASEGNIEDLSTIMENFKTNGGEAYPVAMARINAELAMVKRETATTSESQMRQANSRFREGPMEAPIEEGAEEQDDEGFLPPPQ